MMIPKIPNHGNTMSPDTLPGTTLQSTTMSKLLLVSLLASASILPIMLTYCAKMKSENTLYSIYYGIDQLPPSMMICWTLHDEVELYKAKQSSSDRRSGAAEETTTTTNHDEAEQPITSPCEVDPT